MVFYFFFFPLSWIIMLSSGTWVPLLNFFFPFYEPNKKPLYSELVLCPAWQSLSVPAPMISPMFDDSGHSFTWPSTPVNVPDWVQGHCHDRDMSAVGDFRWTVTPRLWLCKRSKKERRAVIQWTRSVLISSGRDPCWQPVWITQIETTSLASLAGLGLDLVRSVFNFLCLWKDSTCVCWLSEGLGAMTTASVNLTFKFHSGLEAPVPTILKQQYIPIFQMSGNSDCKCFLVF